MKTFIISIASLLFGLVFIQKDALDLNDLKIDITQAEIDEDIFYNQNK